MEGLRDEDDAADAGGVQDLRRHGRVVGGVPGARFAPAHRYAELLLQDIGDDVGLGALRGARQAAAHQHRKLMPPGERRAVTQADEAAFVDGIAAVFLGRDVETAAEDDDRLRVLRIGEHGAGAVFERRHERTGYDRQALREHEQAGKHCQTEGPASFAEDAGQREQQQGIGGRQQERAEQVFEQPDVGHARSLIGK